MSNPPPLIYQNVFIYSLIMRILYRNHFHARYQEIARLIPAECSVVDVCAGDCYLYRQYLRPKSVRYIGLDVSPQFVRSAQNLGVNARLFDARTDELPRGDILVMQGSLYQFLPDAEGIVQKMLSAAQTMVIIAEPIHNLSSSKNVFIATAAKFLTQTSGTRHNGLRFDKESLQELFCRFDTFERSSIIHGKREMIGIFRIRG